MRVKQLVVINLSDAFAQVAQLDKLHTLTEDRQVAKGLHDKHVGRTDGHAPMAAWWIEINNKDATGDADALEPGRDYRVVYPTTGVFAGVDDKEPDVGVYIIYHAKQSSDPNIFGVTPLGSADKKSIQANRLVGVLEKLKIMPIRKLSLVACHSDSGKTAASKNFLVAFGQRIEAWGKDARPMIAGYDDYVTAGLDGKKVVGNEHLPAANSGHKHVWVYRSGMLSGGYKEVELEKAGWSDKLNLPTDNKTAIVS